MKYEEYTTARGMTLKIYGVNPKILAGIKTSPKPIRPTLEIEILKGKGKQSRPIKEGDAGWEEYQEELRLWEEEKDEIEDAVSLCLALRDVEYPNPITLEPHIQELVDDGIINLPNNKYSLKAFWLRENILGQHDEYEIAMIVSRLNGLPEDIIQKQKDRFRNLLLGETPKSVGSGVKERSDESEDQCK